MPQLTHKCFSSYQTSAFTTRLMFSMFNYRAHYAEQKTVNYTSQKQLCEHNICQEGHKS